MQDSAEVSSFVKQQLGVAFVLSLLNIYLRCTMLLKLQETTTKAYHSEGG